MRTLKTLFDRNSRWAAAIKERDPDFFLRLSNQQAPEYLWIGCSDSRVPATEIVDLLPGEIFVHRNIANLVVHSDLNCLSVIQFAVEALKVKHIIVCGHYGCGGVRAAVDKESHGLMDNWLQYIRDIYRHHSALLDTHPDGPAKLNLLCELNVMEQVWNVCRTSFVQSAWDRGAELNVHGWIYDVGDGILKDLDVTVTNHAESMSIRRKV
jgi:carbonic anhydrase